MYTLKLANSSDTDRLIVAAHKAYTVSPYISLVTFDPERITTMIHSLINLGVNHSMILYAEDNDTGDIIGILAATSTFTLVGLEPIAAELMWWVSEDAKKTRLALQLVKGLEFWARKLKLSGIAMSNMENNYTKSTEKFYSILGYRRTESTFFKSLEN